MDENVTLDLVLTPPRDAIDAVVEQAQVADEHGFAYVSMGEVTGWNAVPVLTQIAERTEQVGITNDVFSPYSRSPALLAQTGLTLQEATGGRYRLGVGTSSPAVVEGWHGGSFDRPLRRVREAIDIIREIASGDRVSYNGDIFEVGGHNYTREIPDAPFKIDVASLGPKSVELAGRFADGWIPQLFTREGLRHRLEDLHRGADLGNRDPDELRVSPLLRCFAHEDGDHAREQARGMVAFLMGAYGPYYGNSIADQGYPAVVDEVRAAWDERDTDAMAAAVPDDLLEEVVGAGTPEEVRDYVAEYGDIEGVSAVRIGFIDGMSAEQQRITMDALAPLI